MEKTDRISAVALKLKALRNRTGLSVRAVGAALGIPATTYASYEDKYKKTFIPIELANKLIGVFCEKGIRKEEILELAGVTPAPTSVEIAHPVLPSPESAIFELGGKEFARIPVYDVQFSAGFGAQNDHEQPLDYHVLSVDTLRRLTDASIQQLLFLQVRGDSMEPLLLGGDWVLVDASRTNLVSPAIYAIVYDGEGFLKHASKSIETEAITLVSHNPAYPPQTVTSPDKLRIVGRVVLSIRKH